MASFWTISSFQSYHSARFSLRRYFLPLLLLLLLHFIPSDCQIIETDSECQHASDCDYPNNECCFYKEVKRRLYHVGVSGKCCFRGSFETSDVVGNGATTFHFGGGGGNSVGGGAGGGGNAYGGYYRFSSWNMWYFWFVVIFLLLSCLGACGYWRRRQWILSFQNSHRALPLGHQQQQQQQRHHHHHHQLPLTHPLSLTMGGGGGVNASTLRASPLPVSSAARPQPDYVTGLSAVANPPPSHHHHHLHHSSDPRSFVAPPDFNLYAAHASIRAPPMFAPAPTRIASQLYANNSSTAPSTVAAAMGAASSSGAHPPLLVAPIVGNNGASVSGVLGGGDGGLASPGLPPSYVEAVSGAADAKRPHAAGISGGGASGEGNDKKIEDLPPSYAEAVAQMMHPSLPSHSEHENGTGGVDPRRTAPVDPTPTSSAATMMTRGTTASLAPSTSRMSTSSLFPRSGGDTAATTTPPGGGGVANLSGVYDPITSLTRNSPNHASGGN